MTDVRSPVTQIPVMRPWIGEEEAAAAAAAITSGWIAQGPRVSAFETAFAERVGAPHGVAVSSCTTALHLALVLADVGPGDDVVVPSLSFIATTNVVRYVGATPVFADVELTSGNVTAEAVAAALTDRTRAVIAVDQAGVPLDLAPILELCAARDIVVIEDAACAVGSTYHGAPVGSGAEVAAFSFHPRKLLTTGEGGMLVTSRADWAVRARRLREHGMSVSAAERHASGSPVIEAYDEVGFNYRMTDIQAAVGLIQLNRLDALIARRRELAAVYQRELADIPGLRTVTDPPHGTTNYQSFWVLLPEGFPMSRNELLAHLGAQGISARRGIMAAHTEPAHADVPTGGLPATERLTADSLVLPLYHDMTEEDQERVVDAVATAADGRR